MSRTARQSSGVAVQVSDGVVQVTMSVAADHSSAAALFEACELAAGLVRLRLEETCASAGMHLCRVVKEAEARAKAHRSRLLVTAADPLVADLLTSAGIVVERTPPHAEVHPGEA